MSLSALMLAVQSILVGVTGITPLVYRYEPWAAQASAVRTAFVHQGRVQAWTISRRSTAERHLATGHENERTYTVILRAYYALANEGQTEGAFQQTLEAVCNAFRLLPGLNGTAATSEPLQIDLVEPRVFCEVLCHYAELRLEVLEFITW